MPDCDGSLGGQTMDGAKTLLQKTAYEAVMEFKQRLR
jgi:hypothetical protein